VFALVFLAALTAAPASARAADACLAQAPAALVARLEGAFPGWRLPIEGDNVAEDVAAARARGHSGCLGIARGDYDGDGRDDRAVMLVAGDGEGWQVVVGLRRPSGWKLEKLAHAGAKFGRRGMYLETGRAGHYTEQGSYEDDPPWLHGMSCGREVVLWGGVERSEYVACRARGRWWFVHSGE
jgi:hypothetical protein